MKKVISFSTALCIVFLTVAFCFGSMGSVSASASSADELWMMPGCNYSLMRGQRREYTASPYEESGEVFIPIAMAADYVGAEVNDGVITLSGGTRVELSFGSTEYSDGSDRKELAYAARKIDSVGYLSLTDSADVFGLYSFLNPETGLAVLSTQSISLDTTYASLDYQIEVLCDLIFDHPSADQIFSDLSSFSGVGTHPRILVDQDRFDELRAAINSGTEDTYFKLVDYFTAMGIGVFQSHFALDRNGSVVFASDQARESLRQPYYIYDEYGNRLVGITSYTYVDENGKTVTVTPGGSEKGNGYDEGGRSAPNKQTVKLKYLAFTWQITGDDKYADAFYLLAMELGKWEHWGDSHFLNVADAAVEFAMGLDWIWGAFEDEPEKLRDMAEILYEKGLMPGYYSLTGQKDKLHLSSPSSGSWKFDYRDGNWQTVCGSGLIVSALLLADYEDFKANSMYVASRMLETYDNCVLSYAPDGGYVESPGYWGYGTNTLMITLGALESACGTDYGCYSTVGLHDSFYFATYITNSSFLCWNYHDGARTVIPRESYYLASRAYADADLAAFRTYMLEQRGVEPGWLDVLFYDPSLEVGGDGTLNYDYYNRGIDTVTLRNGWDEGSDFIGIHAGPNSVPHGDIDSGNVFIELGGVLWVADLGSENYNIGNYFSSGQNSARYKYYRKSVEAHSTVLIRSTASELSRGQAFTKYSTDFARVSAFSSTDEGAYTVINMRPSYGSKCTSATRGLLYTNSRSTVVLQDDISFSTATNLTWVLALQNFLEISEDGRTAYARKYVGDEPVTLRLTLLSEDESLKFRVSGQNETLLPDTVAAHNTDNPKATATQRRLLIEANGVTSFNVAVVFDIIRDNAEVVGYSYTDVDDWAAVSDAWVKEANKDIVYPEPTVKPKYGLSNFVSAINKLEKATSLDERAQIINRTMICLTDYDKSNVKVQQKVDEFLAYVARYNEDVKALNAAFEEIFSFWIPSPDPF